MRVLFRTCWNRLEDRYHGEDLDILIHVVCEYKSQNIYILSLVSTIVDVVSHKSSIFNENGNNYLEYDSSGQ
jgi:hypothetical protein